MNVSPSELPKYMLTMGDCAEQSISKFVRKIALCEAAVLDDTDPEPLHRMRVGMRRLRTVLQNWYLGTIVDISDRKAGEQKIREQAALLNVATDAIIMCDLENRIQFWNNGAECLYGWQAAETIGLNKAHLFHLNRSPEAAVALNTVHKQGAWQGELHKLTKAGKEDRFRIIHSAGNYCSSRWRYSCL
jgi:PAS domain S-box-containing protein